MSHESVLGFGNAALNLQGSEPADFVSPDLKENYNLMAATGANQFMALSYPQM
jgi:hypothetical protein